MKKKCDELLEVGDIYCNPCAPLIVPKEGSEKFRFTVDLHPVNAQTKKNVWPMPHADPMLAKLAGAKTFFQLDFIRGYWQFPLAKYSRSASHSTRLLESSLRTVFFTVPRIPFRTSSQP